MQSLIFFTAMILFLGGLLVALNHPLVGICSMVVAVTIWAIEAQFDGENDQPVAKKIMLGLSGTLCVVAIFAIFGFLAYGQEALYMRFGLFGYLLIPIGIVGLVKAWSKINSD